MSFPVPQAAAHCSDGDRVHHSFCSCPLRANREVVLEKSEDTHRDDRNGNRPKESMHDAFHEEVGRQRGGYRRCSIRGTSFWRGRWALRCLALDLVLKIQHESEKLSRIWGELAKQRQTGTQRDSVALQEKSDFFAFGFWFRLDCRSLSLLFGCELRLLCGCREENSTKHRKRSGNDFEKSGGNYPFPASESHHSCHQRSCSLLPAACREMAREFLSHGG